MNIFDVKRAIESGVFNSFPLIFEGEDFYIANQYISKLCRDKQLTIEYIDSLDIFLSIFGIDTQVLYVYKVDELESIPDNAPNLVVLCKKATNVDTIKIPKLTQINIKNFAAGMLEGVKLADIEWLCEVCNYNIYSVTNELSKYTIFPLEHRQVVIDIAKSDNSLEYLTQHTVFTLSDAIISRDLLTVNTVLKNKEHVDINEIGLVKILIKNFTDVARIQLQPNATAQQLGFKEGQFKAIKYYRTNKYTAAELAHNLKILSGIDQQIKTGYLPVELILDYIIVQIL